MRVRVRVVRVLVVVLGGAALAYGAAVAWVAGVGYETPPVHADVAVVLGAAVWNGGRASPVLQRRCRAAEQLWNARRVDWIATTGGVGRAPPSEGESARDYLVGDLRVDPTRVLVETSSHDTFDNLRLLRPVLAARGLRRVFVVSNGYHLARAVRMARDLGYDAWGVALEGSAWRSVRDDPARWLGEARWALLYALARVFAARDPWPDDGIAGGHRATIAP